MPMIAALRACVLAAMVLCAMPASAAEVDEAVRAPAIGGHGMVLFGGAEGLYAAHLPMFHPPHDYQVVLRLRFDADVEAGLRRTLAAAPALWTLDPERFDLTRLDPRSKEPLRTFTATLFEGHFERGGDARRRDVQVQVDAVLLFRRLDPHWTTAADLQYRVIGEGRERFLVKLIDSRPDFDHIVAIDGGSATAGFASLPRHGVHVPSGDTLAAFVRDRFGAAARIRGVAYADAQDLQ